MRIQDVLSGGLAVRLGLWIGQRMPRSVGYGISRIFARLLVHGKPQVYWVVRSNLCQVVGRDVGDEEVRQVFCHAGQTYYDFFRAIGQPPHVLVESVYIDPLSIERIHSEMDAGRGVLLLGVHMSNFDLALLALAAYGCPAQILSLAEPRAGFALLDDLRRGEGCTVTPVSARSLRAAIGRLGDGGMVITGADWPVPGERARVEFFCRPSYLPLGPARLALMSEAMVLVGACHHDADRGYVLDISEPIEMTRTGNRRQDVLDSTRRLALTMEESIRARPTQWMMFHPVWPERYQNGEEQ